VARHDARVTHAERIQPGPFSRSLGFRLVRADESGALIAATPGPDHVNGGGIVRGGYLS
jgi:acyl-CoA thioesterase